MEFDELMEKYKFFKAYEKTRFLNDTLENQQLVIKGVRKLIDRINEIWDQFEKMDESQKQKYIDLI